MDKQKLELFNSQRNIIISDIDNAINVLSTSQESIIGKDPYIDDAIKKIMPFLIEESGRENLSDVEIEELTINTFTRELRQISVGILSQVKYNLQSFNPKNADHVDALSTLMNRQGNIIISSDTPAIAYNKRAAKNTSMQQHPKIIELAFIAAFRTRFDMEKYAVSVIDVKGVDIKIVNEFINITGNEGIKSLKTGDISIASDKLRQFLTIKYKVLEWSKDDALKFIEGLEKLGDYISGLNFVQTAANMNYTADVLNNPSANLWLYTGFDLGLFKEEIEGGTFFQEN